jgi:hypothetical protein
LSFFPVHKIPVALVRARLRESAMPFDPKKTFVALPEHARFSAGCAAEIVTIRRHWVLAVSTYSAYDLKVRKELMKAVLSSDEQPAPADRSCRDDLR